MAEIPPLLEVTSQIARNQRASPVLVCSKIVPASSECCLPQAAHSSISRTPVAVGRPWPQPAQQKPSGQRRANR